MIKAKLQKNMNRLLIKQNKLLQNIPLIIKMLQKLLNLIFKVRTTYLIFKKINLQLVFLKIKTKALKLIKKKIQIINTFLILEKPSKKWSQ